MSKNRISINSQDIAVVGLGCYYPGAKNPLQLWENILTRRQQFREMPDVRLPNSEYYDPDPEAIDKTYQNKAAVLDGYEFNWLEKRIPKKTYESTDIVHWLALDTALQALSDAGIETSNLPFETAGVVLGNSLTGEFTRSNNMQLRWPYVKKALRYSLKSKGLSIYQESLENALEKYYKSVFVPVNEDTLAGGLSNTIAGRVCNFLNINGGGFTVDGACSSSLLAICTAANYLELGQMDLVIAGGVDISLDTFELIGFAKTSALTQDEMRVYDKNGKGFIPGEGCGMVILKRLEDALRDKNQIYSILKGWGISSDGKGGITAPSAKGQSMALIRAYKKAGFNPGKLSFIEGHGTGTTVGDRTELEGISIALSDDKTLSERTCGVTSLKSIIGHTKAAAGAGAFIKTVMALNRRVIPPTAGMKERNQIFDDVAKKIYPIVHGEKLDNNDTIYAGVSAMGFGGINSHVILQSGEFLHEKLNSSLDERKLMVSNQTHEFIIFSADDKNQLIEKIKDVIKNCKGISYAELTDFAYFNNIQTSTDAIYRAAVVAENPFALERKLNQLLIELEKNENSFQSVENDTIIVGTKKENLRIGGLFPGQGSQRLNMTYKLFERYDWVKELYNDAEKAFALETSKEIITAIFRPIDKAIDNSQLNLWRDILKQTSIAQPAIILDSLAWKKYLEKIGIQLSAVTGHSLGELMSFHAAGFLTDEEVLRFAAYRGKIMADCGSGSMASLVCTKEKAEDFLKKVDGYVTIANVNDYEQTVISGEDSAISQVIKIAEAENIAAFMLPVSAAFHSMLVAEAADSVKKYPLLNHKNKKELGIKLISSVTGKFVDKKTNLNAYFSDQSVSQVNFIEAVKCISSECDVMIEIGPGKVLSGLAENISSDIRSFPVETRYDDDFSLNVMHASLFVMGASLNVKEIYKDRLIREFVPAYEKKFLVNPCERPFPEIKQDNSIPLPNLLSGLMIQQSDVSVEKIAEYLDVRADFIKEIIHADMKYFNLMDQNKGIEKFKTAQPVAEIKINIPESAIPDTGVEETIYTIISNKTGFPKSGLKPEYRLLNDLNLDSIKAGSILSEITKKFKVQGKLEAAVYANASIADICKKIGELTNSLNQNTSKSLSKADVKELVFSTIEKKTGFPADQLNPEFKLLNDLNLDSIKAGALLAEISKCYKLQGKIDQVKYSNASISDIIEKVFDLSVTDSVKNNESPKSNTKIKNRVQSYTVSLNMDPVKLMDENSKNNWKNKKVALVHTVVGKAFAWNLFNFLTSKINLQILELKDFVKTEQVFDVILVLIPSVTTVAENPEKIVELLASVASYRPQTTSEIGFIQIGDGHFSRSKNVTKSSNLSAVAFAASIHLERPEIKIRVLEFEESISADNIVNLLLKDFSTAEMFSATGFNKELQSCQMEYDIADYGKLQRRKTTITSDDVFIVTGGAKGITAECAFAMSRKYACKVALIGASTYKGEEGEIKNTLERYKGDNLNAKYYSCDITDLSSVKNIVNTVTKDFGKISGVIHGAGKNAPRRSEHVLYIEALDEISPKIKGAVNLCQSLNISELKYFVALTSIIGVTGMTGNSWYAFSNETLDLLLRDLGTKYSLETLSLAYSVWSEVGMGERMGSTNALADMGIGAIPPEKGVEEFMKWLEYMPEDNQVVIASELGNLDTWFRKKDKNDEFGRYLEQVNYFTPGTELIVHAKLNRNTDTYLEDHNYKGSLLFPTVFGLEAMTEAAALVVGINDFSIVILENISLAKPIVVPNDGELEIEIKAIVEKASDNEMRTVKVGISTEHSEFSEDHFSAVISFKKVNEKHFSDSEIPENSLSIHPENDLYSWLLFQGKRFQLIDKVFEIRNEKVQFNTKNSPDNGSESCFSIEKRAPFIIGNPLLRDTLLQSVQLMLTKNLVLPVSIKQWKIYDHKNQYKGGRVECTLINWDGDKGLCNVVFTNEKNEIIEQIEGYEIKGMEPTPQFPEIDDLVNLDIFTHQRVTSAFSAFKNLFDEKIDLIIHKHHSNFNKLNSEERHSLEQNILQKERNNILNSIVGDITISWLQNGKPVFNANDAHISISHCNSYLLMSVGKSEQGCDIEFVEKRTSEQWNGLLEGKYTSIIENIASADNNTDLSNTRIWCVREVCMKSQGFIPLTISVLKTENTAIVLEAQNGNKITRILTFPVELLPGNIYVIALQVKLKTRVTDEKITLTDDVSIAFDKINKKFITHFYTTFKDCRGFYSKTYFTDYALWMGNLREYILAPIKKELMKDLNSGEFGMVTNDSTIRIYNEADTLEKITGKLWITEKSDLNNSFIDLAYEWIKYSDNGKVIKLADCVLSTTWVKIEKRGTVKLSPLPTYFYDFMNSHLRNNKYTSEPALADFPGIRDLGNEIYKSPSFPRPEILLNKKIFQTGIYNANTVGNLYYSNYYDWQAKTLEHYLFQISPAIFLQNGKSGEYICLETNVNHLQEAMPFEEIEVCMYLQEIFAHGFKLFFEFYSIGEKEKKKLAYGHNIILWAKRTNENSSPKAVELPTELKNYLMNIESKQLIK